MTWIDQLDDPRVASYLGLRLNTTPEGQMIIETEKVIKKAILTDQKFLSIFCTEKCYEENKDLFCKVVPSKNLFVTSRSNMENIVGFKLHHGALAHIKSPKLFPINDIKSPVVILNAIEKMDNVGVIIRNCVGMGIEHIILDEKTCSPFSRRVARVSTGHLFQIKISQSKNIINDIPKLKKNGFTIIGSAVDGKTVALNQFVFPKNFSLIIGNEGRGMDKSLRADCDHVLYIPMKNNVNSLNASSSLAIFLYAAQVSQMDSH